VLIWMRYAALWYTADTTFKPAGSLLRGMRL
jgi:hypothetical protein